MDQEGPFKPYARNYSAARKGRKPKVLRRCRTCGEERVTSGKSHSIYKAGARAYCGPFNVVRE